MNRVNQVYEDDLSIRMQLVDNNDLLNLNTWDDAIAPNGPCGAAACFTQSQVTGCSSTARARFVIGQIIGASNYDIGHLALGQPGGGVANLGVVGRSNKAGGCTGIPTPIGRLLRDRLRRPRDGPPVQRQPSVQRQPAQLLRRQPQRGELGRAGQRLVDHGVRGHLPHRRPAAAQRPVLLGAQPAGDLDLHVVEPGRDQRGADGLAAALRRRQRGPGRHVRARLRAGRRRSSPLSVAINAAPSATSRGGAEENGNTVTIATGNAAHAPGRRHGHDRRASPSPATTAPGRSRPSRPRASFQYTNPTSGLATSGGGTVTLAAPGASESGTTVDDPHLGGARPLGRRRVVITGVGVAGYNGTFQITAVPTPRSFEYTAAASGLANSGGGIGDVLVAVPGPDRRQRLGRDRRLEPAVQQRQHPGRDQRDPRLRRDGHGHGRRVDRLHRHVRRRLGRHRRAEHRARQPQLRRLLRLGRGDEPRRRERLVHAQLRRQRLGTDHERRQLHRSRDPRGADADPARRRDGDGGRLRRRARSTTPASRSRSRARSPRRTCR